MSANRYINKLCYAFRAISASLQTMLFCWVWLLTLQNKHTKNNTKTKTGVRCPVKATNIICKLSRSIKKCSSISCRPVLVEYQHTWGTGRSNVASNCDTLAPNGTNLGLFFIYFGSVSSVFGINLTLRIIAI